MNKFLYLYALCSIFQFPLIFSKGNQNSRWGKQNSTIEPRSISFISCPAKRSNPIKIWKEVHRATNASFDLEEDSSERETACKEEGDEFTVCRFDVSVDQQRNWRSACVETGNRARMPFRIWMHDLRSGRRAWRRRRGDEVTHVWDATGAYTSRHVLFVVQKKALARNVDLIGYFS